MAISKISFLGSLIWLEAAGTKSWICLPKICVELMWWLSTVPLHPVRRFGSLWGGAFCGGNSGLGQQPFFFSDFGDAWVFHGSLAWVWLVHHRKVGNCPYPEFPRYFWRNHGRLRGDLCCVATLLRRSFQGGQLRWSYCCCVQRTEG